MASVSISAASAARRIRRTSRSCSVPPPTSTSWLRRRASASQASARAARAELTVRGSTSIETKLAQMIPSEISCTRATAVSKMVSGAETDGKPINATV
jgi:hypothetical protein